MFGPRPPFSLPRIIGGISKTLGVVNEIIPIYKEAKPIISNMKGAMSIIKEFGNTTTNRIITKKEENLKQVKNDLTNMIKSDKKGPTFFQ